jgi:pimeloyl-ACP methyl ester carboxylesterase
MGKIIIGIHGLGNKPSKEILTEWWEQSIKEGLEKIGRQTIDFNFELVYWADVFYDQPLDPTISDPDHPLYIDEIYTPSLPGYVPEPHPIRKKILDILEVQLDRIFLNEDYTINFSFISDSIIHAYFKELDNYYSKECPENENLNCLARDVIRKRTAEVIKKYNGEEILVIGHSMGSIIAYDVLTFTTPDAKIDTFITIGSPLGLPVIMAKIAAERKIKLPGFIKLKSPPSLQKKWFNYSDLEDRIALIYNLTDNYDSNLNGVKVRNVVVNNDYSINGKSNPHKSFGYLRTPELSVAIQEFLESKKGMYVRRLASRIKNFVKPIFHNNK